MRPSDWNVFSNRSAVSHPGVSPQYNYIAVKTTLQKWCAALIPSCQTHDFLNLTFVSQFMLLISLFLSMLPEIIRKTEVS